MLLRPLFVCARFLYYIRDIVYFYLSMNFKGITGVNNIPKTIVYLVLSVITLVAGYAYLRYAYHVTDEFPFGQEIVIIILGTVSTIFITSLLLNKQTSVEIEKEQNVRHLDLKANTYEQLLDLLETMSLLEKFTNAELVRLRFITHKLAIIASPDVLNEYQSFLDVVTKISADKSFIGDAQQLHEALGALTMQIRQDLIGDQLSSDYTQKQVNDMIRQNSRESVL